MNQKESSLSLQRFREDVDEIFNNIIVVEQYEILSYLSLNANFKDLTTKYPGFFKSLKKIEENNFINNSFFVQLISIMEVYLQDRLIEEINNNKEKMNNLIKEYRWSRKFTPDDVINGPIVLANEIMNTVVFHKLEIVNYLYRAVLGFDILDLLKNNSIWDAIHLRHKITHRAGKVGDQRISVSTFSLLDSINNIFEWIENIDYYYRKNRVKKASNNYVNRYVKYRNDLDKTNDEEISSFKLQKLSRSDFFKTKPQSKLIII